MKKTTKGFSLIELLMVISIMGMLAAMITANLSRSTKLSRDARRKNDLSEIRKALRLYFEDNGRYPLNTDDDGSGWDDSTDGIFIQPLVEGGYLKQSILDPKNAGNYKYSYQYYDFGSTSCGGDFIIVGVRKFEAEPKIENYAKCPGGEDWSPLFDHILMEGE